MNPERVRRRGLKVLSAHRGALRDYALVFDKLGLEAPGAGHANVIWTPGSQVEGVLYELKDHAEIQKMDVFERAPDNYSRDVVPVVVEQKLRWAWTYFANRARRSQDLRPSSSYLAHLLAGAEYLSDGYLQRLKQTRCLGE